MALSASVLSTRAEAPTPSSCTVSVTASGSKQRLTTTAVARACRSTLANPSRATAYSTWCYITRDDADRPTLSLLGHYDDVLTKDGDRWKFLRRVAYCDMPYEVLVTQAP